MVVVTDGESHDEAFRESVIAECNKKGITRFGIAVSDVARSAFKTSSRLLTRLGALPGAGLLHKKQHRHGKPDQRNQIHRQRAHGELLLQRVRGGGSVQHRRDSGRSHLQHRRFDPLPISKDVGVRRRGVTCPHTAVPIRYREGRRQLQNGDVAGGIQRSLLQPTGTEARPVGCDPRPTGFSLPRSGDGRRALLRDTFQACLRKSGMNQRPCVPVGALRV